MNNLKIALLFAVMCVNGILAQIRFEPGYYVNQQGAKVSGLIRNVSWKDNPESIDFRTDENAASVTIPLSQMQEFAVGDGYLYKKFDLQYDSSTRDISSLSATSAPVWQQETAMVKVLLQGALTLFEYSDHSLTLFYISDSSAKTPEQLIFKEYRTEDGRIAQNKYYRQQLYNAMLSKNFAQSDFEKLAYERRDLMRLVGKFNGNDQKDLTNAQRKSELHLHAKIGASSAKLDYDQIFYDFSGDFGTQLVPMAGLEGEFVLPFNQKKWAIIAGVSYQSYKGDDDSFGTRTFSGEYSFVETPIGLRHFFYLGKESRIFLNAGLALAWPTKSELKYTNTAAGTFGSTIDASRSSSVFGGIGFAYGRLSAELRLNAKRQVVTDLYWRSDYSSTGIALGYRIF